MRIDHYLLGYCLVVDCLVDCHSHRQPAFWDFGLALSSSYPSVLVFLEVGLTCVFFLQRYTCPFSSQLSQTIVWHLNSTKTEFNIVGMCPLHICAILFPHIVIVCVDQNQNVTNIFEYSNILVTNIYSDIHSYQFFICEFGHSFVSNWFRRIYSNIRAWVC